MFTLKNVSAVVGHEEILKDINITLETGKLFVVYGERGSGKSSLAHLLSAHPRLTLISGSISLNGNDITTQQTPERSNSGVFIAYQDPPRIDGVSALDIIQKSKHAEYLHLSKSLNLGKSFGKTFIGDPSIPVVDLRKGEVIQAILNNSEVTIFDGIDDGADDEDMGLMASAINAFSVGRKCMVLSSSRKFIEKLRLDTIGVLFDGSIRAKIDSRTYERLDDVNK